MVATTPPMTSTSARVAITSEDTGKLVLRLTLGLLLLFHGLSKVSSGPGPIADMLAQHGIPAMLAYLVYLGEVVAPVLVIVGVWTRPAAMVIAINMLVAIALVHSAQLMSLDKNGGWALELQGFYLLSAISVSLLGAGRMSFGGIGRWN